MALTTGFNVGEINGAISKIAASYGNLINALHGSTQLKFVNAMADKWACKDAQDFFATFKTNIDALIVATNQVYENVYESIKSAGMAWAEVTGNAGSFQPNQIDIQPKTLDVSNILENINNVRGIDLNAANETVGVLQSVILPKIDAALEQTRQAAEQSGFLGGSQQENLLSTLASLKQKMHEKFDTEMSEAKSAINATVQAYGDTASQIAAAFAGN